MRKSFSLFKVLVSDDKISGSKKLNAPYEEIILEKQKVYSLEDGIFWVKKCNCSESEFASYCGSEACNRVANGLDALVLIFRAYIELGKLKKGDQILVPANTYIASILAIIEAGLVPKLVDVNLENYNLDVQSVKRHWNLKLKEFYRYIFMVK